MKNSQLRFGGCQMVWFLVFLAFSFSYLPFLHSAEIWRYPNSSCPNFFNCGKFKEIRFPFTQLKNPACGQYVINCSNQKIQLEKGGMSFTVQLISEADTIFINDAEFQNHLKNQPCRVIDKFPRPQPIITSFQIEPQVTMFKCSHAKNITSSIGMSRYKDCNGWSLYYAHQKNGSPPSSLHAHCSPIQLPGNIVQKDNQSFVNLTAEFRVRAFVSLACSSCHYENGGECKLQHNEFQCANPAVPLGCRKIDHGKLQCSKGSQKMGLRPALVLGFAGLAGLLIVSLTTVFICCKYRKKYSSSNFHRTNSSDLSTRSDFKLDEKFYGIPIFSYTELVEATNNFAPEKELGDGGYGTVYYGKLRDGREVAVKRLYDHSYKKVNQFINEIEILTQLRHQNLVSIYGCTSHHSRELLLVYEYIPNGTVADHLYGNRAKSSPIPWPIRLRIAIETASALVYLHASEIVHRDVKTNNILLDNNFCVKVADFGISRLFPTNLTHISTAPQGTPGYVDPEYFNCYQLTEKSDVFSFGVVLAELLSSMPAVDITRERHDINLSNLAINKIQQCAFDEFIDPSLGYQSDEEVKRMTILVAEVAFLCLQQDKEMRPSMNEVLEELQRIESGEHEPDTADEEENDNVSILKSVDQFSR